VHVKLAGVGSTLPAASMARTVNVRAPAARPPTVSGEVHGAKAPPSSAHSNEPASVAVKSSSTLTELSSTGGCLVMVVSGGVRSTRASALVASDEPASLRFGWSFPHAASAVAAHAAATKDRRVVWVKGTSPST